MTKKKAAKSKAKVATKPAKYACKRCHHTWESRPGRLAVAGRTKPVACPNCVSRYWEKAPTAKSKALVAKKKGKKAKAASAPKKKVTRSKKVKAATPVPEKEAA